MHHSPFVHVQRPRRVGGRCSGTLQVLPVHWRMSMSMRWEPMDEEKREWGVTGRAAHGLRPRGRRQRRRGREWVWRNTVVRVTACGYFGQSF